MIKKPALPLLCIILAALALALTSPAQPGAAGPEAQAGGLQPQVSYAVQQDVLPSLQSAAPGAPTPDSIAPGETSEAINPLRRPQAIPEASIDAAVQPQDLITGLMPAPLFNFDGVTNVNGVLPPDTNGDIGGDFYVQWVNLSMQIWRIDRSSGTATSVYGPRPGNAVWAGFGGECETRNHGDPIVLFDHLAERWLISQFVVPHAGPFWQCIAVSQTSDPTAGWNRYAFLISANLMNDYPKFGVWPDGYYLSINQFLNSAADYGAGVLVFERDKMLLGQPARQVYFDLYQVNPAFNNLLPGDLDGPPPPAGTPNFFASVEDSFYLPPVDALRIWEFRVNWANPAASTFGLNGQPNQVLPVAEFTPRCMGRSLCVPQPGTTQRLDAIGDRLMHRLQFRLFADHGALVANHTVDVNGRSAVRWYELRNTGGGWGVYQQSSYSGSTPNTDERWMASIAMDAAGNIALGYNVSSENVYPSIRYAGRLAGDPLNAMSQAEVTLHAGGGSQTHSAGRWGDYSMLGVDPQDDCTFWFTGEYYAATSNSSWRTRIGSFVFPTCQAGSFGDIAGLVVDAATGAPLAGVEVEAGGFRGLTDAAGRYRLSGLPEGEYTVHAYLYGYTSASRPGVQVTAARTTVVDFSLNRLPLAVVSGVVKDASGQGWPLYARIEISARGLTRTIFTDPLTGAYQTELAQEVEHSFLVSAESPGYTPAQAALTPSAADEVLNFSLQIDPGLCTAPGYALDFAGCEPLAGGLLVGNVYDANTGLGVNQAAVSRVDAPQQAALTRPTPADPNLADGFYTLFFSTGEGQVQAAKDGYQAGTRQAAVAAQTIQRLDFSLAAGLLAADPGSLTLNIRDAGQPRLIRLTNTGSSTVTFTTREFAGLAVSAAPTGPFADALRHVSPKRQAELTARLVYDNQPPAVSLLPGYPVVADWRTGLAYPWGIGWDSQAGQLWLGNPTAGGGDDHLYPFSPQGALGGPAITPPPQEHVFGADLAYDPHRGVFWQVSVGGVNCLQAFDPHTLHWLEDTICPPVATAGRGLAYNPLDRTFFGGSWTDGILYHFNRQGQVLDSLHLGINISGLALNPASGRLYVLNNAALGFDVYVVDARRPYTLLGGFDIPGLGDFEQGGLELDCAGRLWAVNQATGHVLAVQTGEQGVCAAAEAAWFEVQPEAGQLAPGQSVDLVVTFFPELAQGGVNHGWVSIDNDTPYGSLEVPLTLINLRWYFPWAGYLGRSALP